MKFTLFFLVLLSFNSFAFDNQGYVCLPKTKSDASLLRKLGPKIGSDYLPSLGFVVIRPETCAEMHVMIYSDVCQAGPFTVNFSLDDASSELVVPKGKNIQLLCELDQPAGI